MKLILTFKPEIRIDLMCVSADAQCGQHVWKYFPQLLFALGHRGSGLFSRSLAFGKSTNDVTKLFKSFELFKGSSINDGM